MTFTELTPNCHFAVTERRNNRLYQVQPQPSQRAAATFPYRDQFTMSISRRITLLIALTFLAITLIGSFAVFQSRGSANEVKTVTQGVVPSALASAELVGQLKDVQLSVMTIVAAPDLNLAALAEERLQTTQARLQKAFDDQLAQAGSPSQTNRADLSMKR